MNASRGGVGRGGGRRGLLLFALLLVVAQVVLFAVLRSGRHSKTESDSSSENGPLAGSQDSAKVVAAQVPPQGAAPMAPSIAAPEAARTVAAAQPGNEPIKGSSPRTASSVDADDTASHADAGDDKDEDRTARRERDKRERADRERDKRERAQAERDARERARIEAERDRARLEAEKDRARYETERAEKARVEAEREKARLEAERARIEAEQRKPAASDEPSAAPVAPRPTGSSNVLVVVVSARAGGGSLSREEIRNIYFGKTTFWPNNTPVRAYNRPAGTAAGRKFFRSVLGTSAGAFREHWNQLQLSGGGIAPSIVSSADSVVARVAGSSGAIGYLLESELPADVSGVRLIRFK